MQVLTVSNSLKCSFLLPFRPILLPFEAAPQSVVGQPQTNIVAMKGDRLLSLYDFLEVCPACI